MYCDRCLSFIARIILNILAVWCWVYQKYFIKFYILFMWENIATEFMWISCLHIYYFISFSQLWMKDETIGWTEYTLCFCFVFLYVCVCICVRCLFLIFSFDIQAIKYLFEGFCILLISHESVKIKMHSSLLIVSIEKRSVS